MKPTYSELLKDPRWQRKRLEILDRDDWTCQECGSEEKTLHVHHRLYRKAAKPWEYTDEELVTLCADCHERVTEMTAELMATAGRLDVSLLEYLCGCAQALADTNPIQYDRGWVFGDGYMQIVVGNETP